MFHAHKKPQAFCLRLLNFFQLRVLQFLSSPAVLTDDRTKERSFFLQLINSALRVYLKTHDATGSLNFGSKNDFIRTEAPCIASCKVCLVVS